MRYVVNDGCIGCGFCAATCPKVLSMTDEGVAMAIETDIPKEAEGAAAAAKNGCPVSAIEEE